MERENSKEFRIVPSIYTEGEYTDSISRLLPADCTWEALSSALDTHKPKGLGIVLPFSWQMHWYVYKEASKRGIVTAVAMPTNVAALSGLMTSVSIEAVVATVLGAEALVADLTAVGLLERIVLWVIVRESDEETFTPPSGTVVYAKLP